MRRITLGGVPIHPALVHFPLVFWTLVPLTDLADLLSPGGQYQRIGWYCAIGGLATALPAILAGAVDAMAYRHSTAAAGTLWRHAYLMISVWTLFALATLTYVPDIPVKKQTVCVLLHFAASVLLLAGAHAGGRLAHVHRLNDSEFR